MAAVPFLCWPKRDRFWPVGKRRTDGAERETPMLDRTDDISTSAENWLALFESALAKPDGASLKSLFHQDSYWRDVLAWSGNLQTLNGADAILRELKARAGNVAPSGFRIDPDRAAPRR